MEVCASPSHSPVALEPRVRGSYSEGFSGPLSCIGQNLKDLRQTVFQFLDEPHRFLPEILGEVGIGNHEYLLVFGGEKFHRPFRYAKDRNSLASVLRWVLTDYIDTRAYKFRRMFLWIRRCYPSYKEAEEGHVEDNDDEEGEEAREDGENREDPEDGEGAGSVGWGYRRKIIKWKSPSRLNLTVEELFSRCPEELETETQRIEYDTRLFDNDGTEPDKVGEIVHMAVHNSVLCASLNFFAYYLAFLRALLGPDEGFGAGISGFMSFINSRKHCGTPVSTKYSLPHGNLTTCIMSFEYRLRYFQSVNSPKYTSARDESGSLTLDFHEHTRKRSGFHMVRQVADIGRDEKRFHLCESRATVRLNVEIETTLSPDHHHKFHIMAMTDGEGYTEVPDVRLGSTPNPRGFGPATTHYGLEILAVFVRTKRAWDEVLERIDRLVQVELDDFADAQGINDLMFDASFDRSKAYFSALQLLHLVDEWANESITSLEPIIERVSRFASDAEDELTYFLAIKAHMESHVEKICRQTKAKSEAIESLRDGLFNSTSLREATRAMTLNKSIYIFTVVTVLFTPVSFLATFWALPFLNNPQGEGGTIPEPQAFRKSFIIMPFVTYGLVGLCAWAMVPSGRWYSMPIPQLLRGVSILLALVRRRLWVLFGSGKVFRLLWPFKKILVNPILFIPRIMWQIWKGWFRGRGDGSWAGMFRRANEADAV